MVCGPQEAGKLYFWVARRLGVTSHLSPCCIIKVSIFFVTKILWRHCELLYCFLNFCEQIASVVQWSSNVAANINFGATPQPNMKLLICQLCFMSFAGFLLSPKVSQPKILEVHHKYQINVVANRAVELMIGSLSWKFFCFLGGLEGFSLIHHVPRFGKNIWVGSTPHPVTVANKSVLAFPTENAIILVVTVAGWGVDPTYEHENEYEHIITSYGKKR